MPHSRLNTYFQLLLHAFPKRSIHDGGLFTRIDHPFVADLTYISDVAQQSIQPGLGEFAGTMMLPRFASPVLGQEPARMNFLLCGCYTRTSGTDREDLSHPFGFCRVDHQTSALWIDIIAEDWDASHPLPFSPRRRHLVTRSLADDLALELRKRQQDVQREPAQGSAGIELLRDRYKAHAALLK